MPYLYLLLVNLIGVFIVWLDKRKARRNAWRIRERTLFLIGLLGGVPGVYIAMKLFRHKTLHKRFMIGLPTIFAVQIVLFIYFIYWR